MSDDNSIEKIDSSNILNFAKLTLCGDLKRL